MKKLFLLLSICIMVLTACMPHNEYLEMNDEKNQETQPVKQVETSAVSSAPPRGAIQFDDFHQFLDYLSATNPYSGCEHILTEVQSRGYINQIALDGVLLPDYHSEYVKENPEIFEELEFTETYAVNVLGRYGKNITTGFSLYKDLGGIELIMACPSDEQLLTYEKHGINGFMEKYYPKYGRVGNPVKLYGKIKLTESALKTYLINDEEIECLYENYDMTIYLTFIYDNTLYQMMLNGDYLEDIMSRLTLEKVELPDKEEAQARIDERERPYREEMERLEKQRAKENAEAARGPAQVNKSFRGDITQLFDFIQTVDAKTYIDPYDDRSKGVLEPAIEHIVSEGYVLAPYVDGELFYSEKAYSSIQTNSSFGLLHYGYAWVNVNNTQLEIWVQPLSEKEIEAAEGDVLKLRKYDDEEIAMNWLNSSNTSRKPVEITLNGESINAYETISERSYNVEFIYDDKYIKIMTLDLEVGAEFDYSIFDHLTLEKYPITRE